MLDFSKEHIDTASQLLVWRLNILTSLKKVAYSFWTGTEEQTTHKSTDRQPGGRTASLSVKHDEVRGRNGDRCAHSDGSEQLHTSGGLLCHSHVEHEEEVLQAIR